MRPVVSAVLLSVCMRGLEWHKRVVIVVVAVVQSIRGGSGVVSLCVLS